MGLGRGGWAPQRPKEQQCPGRGAIPISSTTVQSPGSGGGAVKNLPASMQSPRFQNLSVVGRLPEEEMATTPGCSA